MTSGSLVLHPADPNSSLDPEPLIGVLREVGILGARIPDWQDAWFVGEQFLQSVSFMGCSPFIELSPQEKGDTDFCHVRIHRHGTPRLMYGRLSRPARCPQCGKPLSITPEDFARMVRLDQGGGIDCANCGEKSAAQNFRWRRDAGLGRLFIEITHIFPGEAVPVDHVMTRLSSLSTGPWRYFYVAG